MTEQNYVQQGRPGAPNVTIPLEEFDRLHAQISELLLRNSQLEQRIAELQQQP